MRGDCRLELELVQMVQATLDRTIEDEGLPEDRL